MDVPNFACRVLWKVYDSVGARGVKFGKDAGSFGGGRLHLGAVPSAQLGAAAYAFAMGEGKPANRIRYTLDT